VNQKRVMLAAARIIEAEAECLRESCWSPVSKANWTCSDCTGNCAAEKNHKKMVKSARDLRECARAAA
jgi:hypothetical protein